MFVVPHLDLLASCWVNIWTYYLFLGAVLELPVYHGLYMNDLVWRLMSLYYYLSAAKAMIQTMPMWVPPTIHLLDLLWKCMVQYGCSVLVCILATLFLLLCVNLMAVILLPVAVSHYCLQCDHILTCSQGTATSVVLGDLGQERSL